MVLRSLLVLFVIAPGCPGEVGADPETAPIPDLTQTDPRCGFAKGGANYCGPVAVSNSLMWLYRDELAAEGVTQYELAKQLGSPFYMNTHPARGTGAMALMRGVEHYLRDRREKGAYLRFQGWKRHTGEFGTGVWTPRLEWIKETLDGGGAVWLELGFYRKGEKERDYRRLRSHWVTAVGIGRDRAGRPHPGMIAIHDPSPRAGSGPSRQFVVLRKLDGGTLIGPVRNLPRSARGLYLVERGLRLPRTADLAILDGAVSLRLRPRKE